MAFQGKFLNPELPHFSPDIYQDNKSQYWDQLTGQVEEKKSKGKEGKVVDDAAQAEHFQVWDKFWGRPGYGAPRQTGQHKENLMKMLHYPKQVTGNYAFVKSLAL